MNTAPACPKCQSAYVYKDNFVFVCPECAYEWGVEEPIKTDSVEEVVKDAYGTPLQNGDTVTVIKDLKIKNSSSVIKVGTKVRNIQLVPGADHNINCKIDGIGAMQLKSEFVKKV